MKEYECWLYKNNGGKICYKEDELLQKPSSFSIQLNGSMNLHW